MPTRCRSAHARMLMAGAALVLFHNVAAKAQTTIVSLTWDGFSAGPRAQDYPPPMDDRDIWVLEDFQTDAPWLVRTLWSTGAAPVAGTTGVRAFILDALPPEGKIVMESLPGTGRYIQGAPWGRYEADFGGQLLEPGSYWIGWGAQGPENIIPVMFVARGEYAVGEGIPDNALQYNPGLAWGLPGGELDPVTEGFNNDGPPVGVNFTIRGDPAPVCRADFNGDGGVTSQDFFAFLTAFFGEEDAADFDGNGAVNSQDFFGFLAAFFAGC